MTVSIKLFRSKDSEIKCKKCGQEIEIGYNILQTEVFESFVKEVQEEELCPKCLMKKRIDDMVEYDPILIETAKNMIGVGVI